MDQHPIPQQISSYEFRLVGDMTLKQFAQVAAGCLLALIFYTSPLPGFLKWPLILLFVTIGVALAFFPIGERPLQTWLIAFLKAIYSPTQFIWQKRSQKLEIFEEKPVELPKTLPSIPPGDQKKLGEYLATLPTTQNPLDQKEETLLKQIQGLFVAQPQPIPQQAAPQPLTQPAPQYAPPLPTTPPWKTERETKEVKFAPGISFPSTPEIPNVLAGMVLDSEGEIVEGAILEIRNNQGIPVRALRTNKLGQFRTATPLPNDIYEIEIEKEGVEFGILKLPLTGQIVQPIEIKAKGELT